MIWYQTLQRAPRLPALALGLLLAAPDAPAGRPLTVDDASIAAPGNCQLESWHDSGNGVSSSWAMPACNFTGNWEVALGAASIAEAGTRRTAGILQGKTILRPLADDGWGLGLVLARQQGAQASSSINVPLSLAWQGQDTLLHANLGATHTHHAGRTQGSWGLALEHQLDSATGWSVERYGQHGAGGATQLGLRHSVLPNRLQLDASWGRRLGGAREHIWSLGLVWSGAPLQ